MFTAAERAAGERPRDGVPRLAARFAAKEAAMKALGVGIGAIGWHDVEVVTAEGGAPSLVVTGRAAALATEQGVTEWKVSLTHTDRVAEAVVVAL
jgi:holo-[acyl-carrier protein] synthase